MKIQSLIVAVILLFLQRAGAQPTGQWDFNGPDPLAATVGGNLQYVDGPGGATQAGSLLGTTTSFGIPDINGVVANVLRFTNNINNAMGYLMPTPATPNGAGGTLVNNYTILFDLLYPASANAQFRPLLDADAGAISAETDYIIDTQNRVGTLTTASGAIKTNTWYRIGIVANFSANEITIYTNGVLAGTQPYGQVDNRYALSLNGTAKLFGATGTNATVGYVNSVQLRNVALNPGQMQALGAASADGIPQTIPPVPSFIEARSPGVGATGVYPKPNLHVSVNPGDTTLDPATFSLSLDGTAVAATRTTSGSSVVLDYAVPTILAPDTVHNVTLVYSDSVAGLKTNRWTFTVAHYPVINLPPPFLLENFDGVAEASLPTGWAVTNATTTDHAGLSLSDAESDSYKDWLLITTNTLAIAKGGDPLLVPPIVLNGVLLTSIANDKLVYAESDSRSGSQVQVLFSPDFDCTGRSNVFLSFHSIYQQNQDSLGAVEYSVDGGATWLPALYMLDSGGDILYMPDGKTIDAVATFNAPQTDTAYNRPYGAYIAAPITQALAPFISPRINDDALESIRVEVLRLAGADNQSRVRLRFLQTGTASWWFGIDEVGLYSVSFPVISIPPQSQTANAGSTVTFTVTASGGPFTYQWNYNGNPITAQTNATLVLNTVTTNDAGPYSVTVRNSSGPTTSATAVLTVIDAPKITVQPFSVLVSAGSRASFAVTAIGRQPLSYQWFFNGTNALPGASGSSLLIDPATVARAGDYSVVIANSTASLTSVVARLVVNAGDLTNGLVLHLTFDGNFNDTSGRTNDATPRGGPTFVPGILGQGMQFSTSPDGAVIQYATLGNAPDLLFGASQDFAISFWAKLPGTQLDDLPWISNKDWNSSNNRGWGVFMQGTGKTRINATGPNGAADKFNVGGTGPVVRDGNWHHIVASFVRGVLGDTIIDGNLVDSRPFITAGSIDTDTLGKVINIGQDGTGVYTDGGGVAVTNAVIDDLGIWRRAISPQEASAIYSAGLAGRDLVQAQVSVRMYVSLSSSTLHITWVGSPTIKLQRSNTLNPAAWSDVPNTLGASSADVPIGSGNSFFRLVQ